MKLIAFIGNSRNREQEVQLMDVEVKITIIDVWILDLLVFS